MPNQCLQAFKVPINIGAMMTSGGTYALRINAGIPYLSKTAADDTTGIYIPIPIPSVDGQHGAKLKSIEVPIRVSGQNLDATPSVNLYRRNMLAVAAAGTNLTASAITGTTTGATLTAAATDRLITFTVTDPALDYDTEDKASYCLRLGVNAGATSALRVYEALAYFEIPN